MNSHKRTASEKAETGETENLATGEADAKLTYLTRET